MPTFPPRLTIRRLLGPIVAAGFFVELGMLSERRSRFIRLADAHSSRVVAYGVNPEAGCWSQECLNSRVVSRGIGPNGWIDGASTSRPWSGNGVVRRVNRGWRSNQIRRGRRVPEDSVTDRSVLFGLP
jgi:hypothetical protein